MPLHPQAASFLATWNTVNKRPLENQPLELARAALLAGSSLSPSCPELPRVEDREIPGPGGPLRLRISWPNGSGPFGVCLYFHGGGWALNSVETHDELARRLTEASGCVFVAVNYRLAPEDPYPAALEDAYAALVWVDEHAAELNIDEERIAAGGDSAGGNIAAALCLMNRDRLGPPIRYQVLIYPIVDCDLTRPSYVDNADGYFLTTGQMKWFWDLYLPDEHQRKESYASPLRAPSLAGLPPAYVLTCEYDPLRDEGDAYAAALQASGVPTTLRRFPGMIHGFIKRTESFDTAHEAIAELGVAIKQAIGS